MHSVAEMLQFAWIYRDFQVNSDSLLIQAWSLKNVEREKKVHDKYQLDGKNQSFKIAIAGKCNANKMFEPIEIECVGIAIRGDWDDFNICRI